MTAEKIRIYDLAKRLKLTNKEVMDLFEQKLHISVKSHSSTVEEKDAEKLEALIKAKPAAPAKSQPAPPSPPPKIQEQPQNPSPAASQRQDAPKVTPPSQEEIKHERTEGTRPAENVTQQQRPSHERPRQEFQQRPENRQPGYDRVNQPPREGGGERPAFPPRPPRPPFGQPYGQRPASPGAGGNQFPPRPPFGKPMPPRQAGLGEKPEAVGKEELERVKSVNKRDFVKKKDKLKEIEELKREKQAEQKIQAKLLKRKKEEQELAEKVTEIHLAKQLTVGELADRLRISVPEVIKQLMMSGIMATVNQTIDIATAKQAAENLGFTILQIEDKSKDSDGEAEEAISEDETIDKSKLKDRAPVVTIMGHVDHGKTTLLDSIRKSRQKIVSTEVGGITQSIGAYTAMVNSKKIVFIDTPGHEAFTTMRARGAQITDIVILVVAADDGIMPQTIEAINHAKAAKVPIIVAVNKIDKPGADPDRVLQQLTEYELVPEKWGGSTITVEISALQDLNIDELLDYIILIAEVEELKADPARKAAGVIIESKLDKGKGAVATFLVQQGTLRVGDFVVAGIVSGKIRALFNDLGERIHKAGPSTPVEVLGLTEIPQAGEKFEAVESDKLMKEKAGERKEKEKISKFDEMSATRVKREMLLQSTQGDTKELNIIIKTSTHGAAEAVTGSLHQLESKHIFVKVVHLAIGDITEADVMLASASNAIVIGFGVKEDQNALRVAQEQGVVIRKYEIIYQMLEDIEKTMLGLLEPEYREVEIGTAEVRQVFTVGKTVKIAGCYVLEGKIVRNKDAKVIRNDKEIFRGQINQLKRFKDDAKEVNSGYECGLSFDKFNDIQEGDIIKVLTKEEIIRNSLV